MKTKREKIKIWISKKIENEEKLLSWADQVKVEDLIAQIDQKVRFFIEVREFLKIDPIQLLYWT